MGLGMGFSPIFFFSIPFSPFWDKDRRWGRELNFIANSCWIYSERDWWQQLSLSQSNARTTGASFVLWEEPCEGHLEVSLGLKRARDLWGWFQLSRTQEPPSWQTEKDPRGLWVSVQKSGHTLGSLSA